jgi:hypothetical protein
MTYFFAPNHTGGKAHKIKEKMNRSIAKPALSKAIELINQTQYSGTNLTIFFCQNATP